MLDNEELIVLTPEQKLLEQEEKLNSSTTKLATKIVKTKKLDRVKDLTAEFNLAQVKKNILRTMKFNDLLDQISDKMSERVEKRPDEFSNKDLIDFAKVAQEILDKSSKNVQNIDTVEAIQVNQQNININVGDDSLSKESREKIMSVIDSILNSANKTPTENNIEYEIIDEEEVTENSSLLNEEE